MAPSATGRLSKSAGRFFDKPPGPPSLSRCDGGGRRSFHVQRVLRRQDIRQPLQSIVNGFVRLSAEREGQILLRFRFNPLLALGWQSRSREPRQLCFLLKASECQRNPHTIASSGDRSPHNGDHEPRLRSQADALSRPPKGKTWICAILPRRCRSSGATKVSGE
jgi:hypothetical protein